MCENNMCENNICDDKENIMFENNMYEDKENNTLLCENETLLCENNTLMCENNTLLCENEMLICEDNEKYILNLLNSKTWDASTNINDLYQKIKSFLENDHHYKPEKRQKVLDLAYCSTLFTRKQKRSLVWTHEIMKEQERVHQGYRNSNNCDFKNLIVGAIYEKQQ
jgi:hypothetical protein